MVVTGRSSHAPHQRRRVVATESAREAIARVAQACGASGRQPIVLVPAYYGFSTREGSGVIDPLQAAEARIVLYRVTRTLHVDVSDYARLLRESRPDLVILIHYFGWPDPAAAHLAHLAREVGALVLEDEAHALLSDFVGGVCGRFGDACAISLHKSLPVKTGGLLVLNGDACTARVDSPVFADLANGMAASAADDIDLRAIAASHRSKAFAMLERLEAAKVSGVPLWSSVPEGVVPLNLPFLVAPESRQRVYAGMNALGFGVICLYHRLGPGLEDAAMFPDSHWLSSRMVNLPLNAGIKESEFDELIAALVKVLN